MSNLVFNRAWHNFDLAETFLGGLEDYNKGLCIYLFISNKGVTLAAHIWDTHKFAGISFTTE